MSLPKDEIRRYIQELKLFYKEIFVSCGIFLICVIAWMTTKGSGFWPLWVLIAFLTNLAFRAISIGVLPKYSLSVHLTKFFNQEWEEKQIEKYIHMHGNRHRGKNSNEADLLDDQIDSSGDIDSSSDFDFPRSIDEDPYEEQFREGGHKNKSKDPKSLAGTDSKRQTRSENSSALSKRRPNK